MDSLLFRKFQHLFKIKRIKELHVFESPTATERNLLQELWRFTFNKNNPIFCSSLSGLTLSGFEWIISRPPYASESWMFSGWRAEAELMKGVRRRTLNRPLREKLWPILLWTHLRRAGWKVAVKLLGLAPLPPEVIVLSRSGLSGTIETAPTERTPCQLSVQTFRRGQREKSMGLLLMSLEDAVSWRPKAFLQDPRRLASQLPAGAEGWGDGCIWEIVTRFSYKQDNSSRQESKSEERLSPLWFELYYLRSVQVEQNYTAISSRGWSALSSRNNSERCRSRSEESLETRLWPVFRRTPYSVHLRDRSCFHSAVWDEKKGK